VVRFTLQAALGAGEEPTAEAAVWATEPVCTAYRRGTFHASVRNRIQIPRCSSSQPRHYTGLYVQQTTQHLKQLVVYKCNVR